MTILTVSVIIPTFNRAHLLPRALDSAFRNLEPGDEVIVVDDGSTDHTQGVLARYGSRIRVATSNRAGAGGARNVGLQHATKDLVAFLDSDDEWYDVRLALARRLLAARPDVLFTFSDFRSREDGVADEPFFLRNWHKDDRPWDQILAPGVPYSQLAALPEGHDDFPVHIGNMFLQEMQSDYVATSTVTSRRLAAGDALRFADDIRISEDKECFGRLAQRGSGAFLNCETSIQWGHNGPRVSDTNAFALVTSRLLLFSRIWELDAEFMRLHGDKLRLAREQQHLKRARWLLVRGRTKEAADDLRQTTLAPMSYRCLAAVPQPVAKSLIAIRSWAKQAATKLRRAAVVTS